MSVESAWVEVSSSVHGGTSDQKHGVQFAHGTTVGGDGRELFIEIADGPEAVVAVVGHHLSSSHDIQDAAERASDSGLPALEGLGGSYSSIIKTRDAVHARTELSGQFPLYYRTSDNEVTVSSQASRLASDATGNVKVDSLTLAAQIIAPHLADLHIGRTYFEGVRQLEPGSTLLHGIDGLHIDDSAANIPLGDGDLHDAAAALREAVVDGLRARAELWPRLGCDFSGGLDSTSLAYLVAPYVDGVATFTDHDPHHLSGDYEHVQRLLRLAESGRLNWSELRTKSLVDSLKDAHYVSDQPNIAEMHQDFLDVFHRACADSGLELHLSGLGGDEIAGMYPARLADVAKNESLWRVWCAARDAARLHRQSPLCAISDAYSAATATPASMLQAVGRDLTAYGSGTMIRRNPLLASALNVDCLEWFTRSARQAVGEMAMERSAEVSDAISGFDHANYTALTNMHTATRMRSDIIRRAAALYGVRTHAPFYDEAVLRAAFSIPGYERARPGTFKEIFRIAFKGLVPDLVLSRQTKSSYNAEFYEYLHEHMREFEGLLTNSRLADLGIIEPSAVRRSLADSMRGIEPSGTSLDMLVASERWLRRLESVDYSYHPFPANAQQTSSQSTNLTINTAASYRLPASMRATYFGPRKGAALLDIKTGRRYSLSDAATAVLDAVTTGATLNNALSKLVSQVQAEDNEAVYNSVSKITDQLLADGLLTADKGSSLHDVMTGHPHNAVTAGQEQRMVRLRNQTDGLSIRHYGAALGGILVAAVLPKSVRHTAFPKALGILQRAWSKADANPDELLQVLQATRRLGDLYPGTLACHEQSMAGAVAAALMRKNVDLVIGAAAEPIRFHAWLEAGGVPVTLDDDEQPGDYQKLYKF